MPETVFDNAPLLEVVAEVRWSLTRLTAIPHGAVDPFFQPFERRFSELAAIDGFGTLERLVPPDLPLELVPNKPTMRLRRESGRWPLFQIGPGILAVNIVPPYRGWTDFRPTIATGLGLLERAYPGAPASLQIEALELRYIDAFGASHGFTDYPQFVREGLTIGLTLPQGILVDTPTQTMESVEASLDLGFPLRDLDGSRGSVRVRPAQVESQPKALVEFAVTRRGAPRAYTQAEILQWLDLAQQHSSRWFRELTTPRTRELFGQERPA